MEINSINNEKIKLYSKLLQKKYRNETGKFILEGYKTIKEAFDYGIKIEQLFVQKGHINDYSFINCHIIETNHAILKKLSSTESVPPAVAVAEQKKYDLGNFKNMNKLILLEGIKDLGNLGNIIRSAVAFGCEGIILYGECADIYNPKCVRSAVGNLWKIPIIHIEKFNVLQNEFDKFSRIATLPRSNNLLKNFNINSKSIIMFGSEADGLSQELINFATDDVKIEMSNIVESLNLATSASIVMYELFN